MSTRAQYTDFSRLGLLILLMLDWKSCPTGRCGSQLADLLSHSQLIKNAWALFQGCQFLFCNYARAFYTNLRPI
ncbi:hypothetical protein EJ08DRAFT_651186 [Tothia fuscella]|uniref:Secreted protein n=1 Tax=Tothia fuscella TaxID=1048955 RepID=A0A9P4TWR8_9PEZI|nr:hypothetical protein EJ08DRAFT_651186 [Tothia fuscella]